MDKYKKILPCGVLRVDNNVYWLLSPEPIKPDSWQHYEQQRFSVVPFDPTGHRLLPEINDEGDNVRETLYGYARHIVCTNPLIEYRYSTEPILVKQIMEYEEREIEEPYEPEPADLKIAEKLFLEEVGASTSDYTDFYLDENQQALETYQNGLDHG